MYKKLLLILIKFLLGLLYKRIDKNGDDKISKREITIFTTYLAKTVAKLKK